MVQTSMLPVYLVSGIFIPNVNLPGWLRNVAEILAVQHLADWLYHAYLPGQGTGVVWSELAVLVLWAAAGLAIAFRGVTSWRS